MSDVLIVLCRHSEEVLFLLVLIGALFVHTLFLVIYFAVHPEYRYASFCWLWELRGKIEFNFGL